jgi:hypothetical protein
VLQSLLHYRSGQELGRYLLQIQRVHAYVAQKG